MDDNILKFNLSLGFGEFKLEAAGKIQNEICGLFGASASGKSTLAKILLGFYPGARGSIRFGEKIWQDSENKKWLATHKRGIGYVPQSGLLFPHLNVQKNVEAGARGRNPAIKKWKFEEICHWLELEPLFLKMPASLSGGERQRVALGRCLNSQPDFIILDEPLASLDHKYRDHLLELISKSLNRAKIPVLYISHSPREIAGLCASMYLMESGRLLEKAGPMELLNKSGSYSAAAKSQNFLRGRLEKSPDLGLLFSPEKGKTALQMGPFPHWESFLKTGRELVVHISGQDVMLATKFPVGLSARNIIPAKLAALEDTSYGKCALCALGKEGWKLRADITSQACAELRLTAGMDLFVIIKAHSITPSE